MMSVHRLGILIKNYLVFILIYLVVDSQGLQCHNCYSFSDAIEDCHPLSVEEVGARLVRDKIKIGTGRPPSLTITKEQADACIKFETEFLNENDTKQHAVVRTQIRRQASSLLAPPNDKVTQVCKLRTDSRFRNEQGDWITTKFCACTADFCNGGSSLSLFFPQIRYDVLICTILFMCLL